MKEKKANINKSKHKKSLRSKLNMKHRYEL